MTFEEANAAYPFDPTCEFRDDLVGFEKLRAWRDPKMRRNIWWAMSQVPEHLRQPKPHPYFDSILGD